MRVYGGSPWTREAIKRIDPMDLEVIEAVLPDGMTVTVGAHRGPGPWVINLLMDQFPVYRLDTVYDIPTGIATAVDRWRASNAS